MTQNATFRYVARTILPLFVLLSVFSVLGMAFMNHAQMNNCPFTVGHVADCTLSTATNIASVTSHIDGFNHFTHSSLTTSALRVVTLILVLVYIALSVSLTWYCGRMWYRSKVVHCLQYTPPTHLQYLRQWISALYHIPSHR